MMLQAKRDPGKAADSENADSNDTGFTNDKISGKNLLSVKIEYDDNHFRSSSAQCLGSSCASTSQGPGCEPCSKADSVDELDHVVLKDRLKSLLPKSCGKVKEELGFDGQFKTDSLSGCKFNVRSNKKSFVNIKLEPNNEGLLGCRERASEIFPFEKFISMKRELSTAFDEHEDVLDHMPLKERMNLLSSANTNCLHGKLSIGVNKLVPFSLNSASCGSKPALSYLGRRPWKKRRTATDSIETAMEEDAPGLLRVLVEQGVMVNEIKLYGQLEDHGDLLSTEETFSGHEDVSEKVSWRSHSIFKLSQPQSKKGEKASYCLGFLLALVEQARYLMYRKWPVEWGWCRDLLSFIFVFKRHNRIVLERPEYGYATYFFELTDSFPIDWQIKRLVTAMKLTNCSRITLLENKPLRIGEDLTLGEARILTEFGWVPNTGLGTMLHYYDRVVHDRMFENEGDLSEWRNKIRKLLVDGYDRGTIISTGAPTPTQMQQ